MSCQGKICWNADVEVMLCYDVLPHTRLISLTTVAIWFRVKPIMVITDHEGFPSGPRMYDIPPGIK